MLYLKEARANNYDISSLLLGGCKLASNSEKYELGRCVYDINRILY
jgi:hypothetical protein